MVRAVQILVLAALALGAQPALAQDAGSDDGPASLPAGASQDGTTSTDEPASPELPPDRTPTLKLTVEPTEVSIGDPITWTAQVRRRVGDRVHLPSSADFGRLEVQNRDRQVADPEDDWVVETLAITLLGFDSGEHEIPAQKLTVVDIEGRIAEIETEPAAVAITSLIANEPEPDLKPDTGPGEKVFEKDYTALYVLAVLAGIAVIALLTLIGRWLWSRRRPRPGPPPPPPRPAEDIALEKLELLRAGDLLEQGLHKEYHVHLSETVREYLGNRYGFDSLELSTEEITAKLRKLELDSKLFARLRELLDETDLVKFAKYLPAIGESRWLLDEAFRAVELTTPSKTNDNRVGLPAEAPAGSEGGRTTPGSEGGPASAKGFGEVNKGSRGGDDV